MKRPADCKNMRLHTRSASSWRTRSEQPRCASLTPVVAVNEPALRYIVGTLIHHYFREVEELEEQHQKSPQTVEACSKKYEELMRERVATVLKTRDERVVAYVRREGADGLRSLRLAGALEPVWLSLDGGDAASSSQLAANLGASRASRQSSLFDRVLSHVRTHKKLLERVSPHDLDLDGLQHVISRSQALELRQGKPLVLDPDPALLPPDQMREAMEDLLACVLGGYGMPSNNRSAERRQNDGFRIAFQMLLACVAAVGTLLPTNAPKS